MARLKLIKTAIEAQEPKDKDHYLWDSVLPRFGLRVTPKGARIYLVQYRAKAAQGHGNKTRRITIGQHGKPWTIDLARDEARRILAKVDLGQDPFDDREQDLQARQREIEAAQLRKLDNFGSVADRYIAYCARLKTGKEIARHLRHDIIPHWKARHIADISRRDVRSLLDTITMRSPSVSRLAYAAMRGLFAWCLERDLIDHSPCQGIKAPPRSTARDRVLSDQELITIWTAADSMGYPYGPIIKLLILTGQRLNEVCDMTWAELDLETNVWRLPKERTKNGKAHELDLSPQARDLIDQALRMGRFVFCARGGGTGFRGYSAAKRKLDKIIHQIRLKADPLCAPMEPWRVHDLRRTTATGCASLGFAPHVIEWVLNHISGARGGLVGVYQRHQYRQERKAALITWGGYVEGLVTGKTPDSNVIPIRA